MKRKFDVARRLSTRAEVWLGTSLACALVVPLVSESVHQLTAAGMVLLGTCLGYAALILASWKPLTAYWRAVDRARNERDQTVAISHKVWALRDLAHAQRAALQAAETPEAKTQAANALERTLNLAEHLISSEWTPRSAKLGRAIAEAEAWQDAFPHRQLVAWVRRSLVSGMTGIAVVIAGRRGARLRDTWMADLAGAPEEGLTLSRWQQVWHASGFMIAAVRIRSHAISAPLWRPIDWVLACESRTRTSITLAVGVQVIYIQKHDGFYSLVTEGWGWCGGCAVALHFFAKWLRKVRGIELAVASHNSDDA